MRVEGRGKSVVWSAVVMLVVVLLKQKSVLSLQNLRRSLFRVSTAETDRKLV
jgi:hypothetical protein